jgi:hypothetical protein
MLTAEFRTNITTHPAKIKYGLNRGCVPSSFFFGQENLLLGCGDGCLGGCQIAAKQAEQCLLPLGHSDLQLGHFISE